MTRENLLHLWEKKAKEAAKTHPLKMARHMPKMVGITEETTKNLRWKSLLWMLKEDKERKILKAFLKHPFRYFTGYLRSLFSPSPFRRDGDFFFYGIQSEKDFHSLLQDPTTCLVLGFSYCHKPLECPSGRFTDQCINSAESPVCKQCFIGKCLQFAPQERCIPLFIPTVHYISYKILDLIDAHPDKKIIFCITACEMTLTMFADWGNMAGIRGIGVRLDGRICNTMRAFELSERGVKPGLTVVLEDTQKRLLHLLGDFMIVIFTFFCYNC